MADAPEKELTPEEKELKWFKEVYQGDKMPQLTVRAVIMGGILGGFMSLSNLYVGLRTGWALGVAITSCILSFAIQKTLMAVFPKWFPTNMSILENNCMQSTASSAGYSTGGTMVSAIAAYLIVTQTHIPFWTLTAWTFFLAALGVFMAIPMKRQMINIEQLRFPSGIAAAETLKSLHAAGGDAVDKARSLGIAGLIGGVIAWLRDAGDFLLIPVTALAKYVKLPAFLAQIPVKPMWNGFVLAIPGFLQFPGKIAGIALSKWTISFEMSAIMIAAGAIMGWKVAWSMLLGAAINYGYLAPQMVQAGAIEAVNMDPAVLCSSLFGPWTDTLLSVTPLQNVIGIFANVIWEPFANLYFLIDPAKHEVKFFANNILLPMIQFTGGMGALKLGYRQIVSWSTWAGASILVSSGLLSFLLQWKTVVRAFGGIFDLFSGKPKVKDDPIDRIEVPGSWFMGGTIVSGLGCMAVLYFAFNTSWLMGFVAVFLTFFLSLVACRATGESDMTPIGAMGKITQLMFGVLAPSNIVTNLMTASVTAGAASSSADLLTDLKSGYVLGANPRQQFIAQFCGIFFGLIVVVPAFYVLVPSADVLGTDKWPAPSAQVWAAVAKLLANGLGSLHITARLGMLYGLAIGAILTLLDTFLPKSLRRFVPSATGVGLAMVIPFFNSLSMFIGAVITLILEFVTPAKAEKYIIPVSSGIIAGESLMGVAVALLSAATLM